MNNLALSLIRVILIGLGATLTTDLWALFLKHAFKVAAPNYCLVGRWLRIMPEGTFEHSNIASIPQKSAECTVGWIAHYMIGIVFATMFLAFTGKDWIQHPTLIPSIIFGGVTVSAPLLIIQPALGLGVAASKTSNPTRARFRSLMNHIVFGIGLYLFGLIYNSLMWIFN